MPGGQLIHAQHLLAARAALPLLALAAGIAPAALNGDPGLGGQLLQAFLEIQAVDPAVEIKNIPGGVAAEAVKHALFLIDGKGGFGFLVEGAGSHPARAVAFELHKAAHDVHDVQALLDGADGVFGLHAALCSGLALWGKAVNAAMKNGKGSHVGSLPSTAAYTLGIFGFPARKTRYL